MSSIPLTEKEKHKKKEQLQRLRQGVMIFLMVIAGAYYVLSGRSQGIGTSLRMETDHSEAVGEDKYTIEAFVTAETAEIVKDGTASTEVGTAAQGITEEPSENHTVVRMESVEVSSEAEAVPNASAGSASSADGRINLNTATLEELDALPGVGPSTAQNIIAYRDAHGGFAAAEEIMNVKRIGEKTYEKLKDYIKVA